MKLLRFCILVLLLAACSREDKNVSINGDLDLTQNERSQLEKAVAGGNSTAALRLFAYYDFVDGNHQQAKFWLTKSADMGNEIAIHNLKIVEETDHAIEAAAKDPSGQKLPDGITVEYK